MTSGGAAARRLNILGIRDRYPFSFNSPRMSRHAIECRRFLPLDKYFPPLGAATFVNPWPPKHFDLLHAWNRIPLGPSPFIIGYESHLPRAWGREHTAAYKILMDTLLSKRCRRIIAVSKAAEHTFLSQHANHPRVDELKAKLIQRYPNVHIPQMDEWFDPAAGIERMKLLFVGGHFARKGGCVAVKLAEKARAANVPLDITIVSSLQYGNGIWTDPTRMEFYDPYLKLLDQPNITHMKGAPNAKVLELSSQSHMSLLPTFGDTFGYSAFESMMCYAPVVATALSSLPEFVNNENGVLLGIETNEDREWLHVRGDHSTPAFEKIFADEVERLADETLAACVALMNDPQRLARMRKAARKTAHDMFNAEDANRYWDDLYEEVVAERRR